MVVVVVVQLLLGWLVRATSSSEQQRRVARGVRKKTEFGVPVRMKMRFSASPPANGAPPARCVCLCWVRRPAVLGILFGTVQYSTVPVHRAPACDFHAMTSE